MDTIDRLTIFEFYGVCTPRVQRPGGPIIMCDGCQRGLPTEPMSFNGEPGRPIHRDRINFTNDHYCTKDQYLTAGLPSGKV